MARTYTVKKDDDLLDLAKKFGVSTSALLAANAGVSSITPGVTLSIPGTTTLLGVDPKSPWTPDLPQPDPKDPFAPPYVPPEPEPDLPDWFPKKKPPPSPGLPDPKSPWTPDLPQPEPVQPLPPQLLPPVAQPLPRTYLPPAQSMAQLEAGRVPQQPVVALTGAQPQPVVPQVPQRPYIPTGVGTGAGLIGPGTLGAVEQFRQTVVPVVQTYLNRLFGRETTQTPVVSYTGAQQREQIARRPGEPTAGARWPVQRPAAPAARDDFYAETVRIANELGVTPTEAARLIQQQGLPAPTQEKFGPPGEFAPPTVGEFEYDPVSGFPVFPGGKLGRHSSIIEWYLDNGLLPFSLYPEDVARFGWTDAELIAAGYVEDAWGNWVRVGMDPNAPAVAAGGGGGGYPAYPRGGGGGGGRGGGGGGAYTYPSRLPREQGPYPQSFVGRASTQFPQSFVQRGQRGVTPTGSSMRPARMGAVTWRI